MKNLCGKTRTKDQPYETWEGNIGMAGWTWKVLKKYKSDEAEAKDPYARWFCFVSSPYCPEGELGDVYVSEIKSQARLTQVDKIVAVDKLFKS
jgi:hypothetical protein